MALDTLQTRFARLLAEYTSSQQTLKQRISQIEKSNRTDDETEKMKTVDESESAALLQVPSVR